jgi:hypothetical protein
VFVCAVVEVHYPRFPAVCPRSSPRREVPRRCLPVDGSCYHCG